MCKERFSFSFPLTIGSREILTSLPSGRYALVISTNNSHKTFGVISPQREYVSQISVEVCSPHGILAGGTNLNYLAFSVRKENIGEITLKVKVEKQQENETLFLHLGRGF